MKQNKLETQNAALKYHSPFHSFTSYGMIRFDTSENRGKTLLAFVNLKETLKIPKS